MEIPFFKPQIDEETIESVAEVLRSGWLTMGPKCIEFEEAFAKYIGCKHAIFVNSCTAALHLCLAAIGLEPGDEVIVPTMTFVATAEVVQYFYATPVLIDCRKDTLCIDETLIEAAITSKTRAIMPMHYGGHPCEMDTILAIAKKHGLKVIEDAAHCLPAYYKGRMVGTIGDATCFSFYANKCITTGEGGMITTDNDEIAEKCRIMRLHGMSKDAYKRFGKGGTWKYDIVMRGYKYNATDMAAAIGLGQLKRVDEFWQGRKRVARKYQSLFENIKNVILSTELSSCQSSWHLFTIRLDQTIQSKRDEIIQSLASLGITTSVHYTPIHCFSNQKSNKKYSQAEKESLREISLPIYPGLSDTEIQYVAQAIEKATLG